MTVADTAAILNLGHSTDKDHSFRRPARETAGQIHYSKPMVIGARFAHRSLLRSIELDYQNRDPLQTALTHLRDCGLAGEPGVSAS